MKSEDTEALYCGLLARRQLRTYTYQWRSQPEVGATCPNVSDKCKFVQQNSRHLYPLYELLGLFLHRNGFAIVASPGNPIPLSPCPELMLRVIDKLLKHASVFTRDSRNCYSAS